jgi:hypothetical protein
MTNEKTFFVLADHEAVKVALMNLLASETGQFSGKELPDARCDGFERYSFGRQDSGAYFCSQAENLPDKAVYCAEVDQATFLALTDQFSGKGMEYLGLARVTVNRPEQYEACLPLWKPAP